MSSEGYKQIKTKDGYMPEHRYIIEQYLGRKLLPNEVVHHIDKNPSNNAISNLKVMTREEHSRMHGKEKIGTKKDRKLSGTGAKFTLNIADEINDKAKDIAKDKNISKNAYLITILEDKIKKDHKELKRKEE